MCSVQHLREFIRERLTAAAEEIFTQVEKTIISYEEELDAQRRMMGISWKPDIKLHRVGSELQRQSSDLRKLNVFIEQEVSSIQLVCTQGRKSSHEEEEAEPQMEPEPPGPAEHALMAGERREAESSWDKAQKKSEPPLLEERDESETDWMKVEVAKPKPSVFKEWQEAETTWIKEEEESLMEGVKEETDSPASSCEEEPKPEQLPVHISPVVERNNQAGSISTMSETQCFTDRCDICGKSFKKKFNLKQHYRIHTGEKPFCCEICGKSFSQFSNLKVHKKIHSGEKPFSCETCGRRFLRIDHLNIHKKIHSGERPFSCDLCSKSFSRIDNLNNHKKIHSGKWPFQTHGEDFCLYNKMNTNERPFSCDTCGKGFRQSSNLNVHRRTHTGQ